MASSGQTINDRLNAVRYALAGQGLARAICKATTEEVLGPKKKHIDYLIACSNEPNVSIPEVARLLIERSQLTSWAVVFKSLTTIHHLMSNGNERFTQYLATSNHSFELNDFMDRTTPQGYNMSVFVRRYAKYVNDKIASYRILAIDLCKIKSGKDNALRTMNMDNLSKTLPVVQTQFDSLLNFGAEVKDLNNGVILAAFRLLYKDLVRLYIAYQEAIINLLERYFNLSRKKTREALSMYKEYLTRMDKVAGFLHIVDAVNIDKSEMPDLTKSPGSILGLLENHLTQLEARKKGVTSPGEARAGGGDTNETRPSELPTTSDAAKIHSANTPDSERQEVKQNCSVSVGAEKQSAGSSGGPSSATSPVITDTDVHQPPQKPARAVPPRPDVSPKVSPKRSPVGSAKPGPSSQQVVPPERPAGPPARPAKPPSRPPPPGAGPMASPSHKAPPAKPASPAPPHPPPPTQRSATGSATGAEIDRSQATATKQSQVATLDDPETHEEQAPTDEQTDSNTHNESTNTNNNNNDSTNSNEPNQADPNQDGGQGDNTTSQTPSSLGGEDNIGQSGSCSATITEEPKVVETDVQLRENGLDGENTSDQSATEQAERYGNNVVENSSASLHQDSDQQADVAPADSPTPPPPPPPLAVEEEVDGERDGLTESH